MDNWVEIKGYEGAYMISDSGKVKSVNYNRTGQEKELIPQVVANGYVHVLFSVKGDRKGMLVHRLVAEAFIPNPENKKTVNHKNGNKSDNRVENLEWNTVSENITHAFRTGLKKHNPISQEVLKKLSEKRSIKVVDIKTGMRFSNITEAAGFIGMDTSQLSKILRGVYKNKTNLRIESDK